MKPLVFRPAEKLAPQSTAGETPPDRQAVNVTGVLRDLTPSLFVRPLKREGANR